MKWTVRNYSFEDIENLQEKYNLDSLLSRVFAARNITDREKVKFFLEKDISFLHNPFLFNDMTNFCDRVLSAVENNEKIRVFGDRDVDGTTSTSLMVLELKNMGADVSWAVPEGDEPYGVSKKAIDKALSEGITLAITVDCGISCVFEIDYANSQGMDFLVTDHHIPGEKLPSAVAIINPKVESCGYPFKDLAGCGVVAKCIWALRFAQTDLYNSQYIFLHAFPGNSTVIIEASKVKNMVVVQSVFEETVPGTLLPNNSRILKFIDCQLPVFVLDSDTERRQLEKVFPSVEINMTDLRSKFDEKLPFTKGKSLFQLASQSKSALYSVVKSELSVLENLFFVLIRVSFPFLYKDYEKLMDFVAIGTISDLMPMVDENRIFVKKGLEQLSLSPRVSLLPLLTLQNLIGKKLTTVDVGWSISPQLNAAGRMGSPEVAVNMLTCSSRERALDFATKLIELNKKRQKQGEQCWDRLLGQAKKTFEQFGSKLVLVKDDMIPRGITGILATRFQKFFNAPAIVITKLENQNSENSEQLNSEQINLRQVNSKCSVSEYEVSEYEVSEYVGSIRSSKGFNCHDFLFRYSDLFEDFGGHVFAGGFSLLSTKVDEFCLKISEDIDWLDFPVDNSENTIEIDAVVSKQEMLLKTLTNVVDIFEPYGEENSPILFMARDVCIENLTVMKNTKDSSNSHVKFFIQYGSYKWPCVFWSAGQRIGTDIKEGCNADVVFKVSRNNFRGQETVQLTVVDIKCS